MSNAIELLQSELRAALALNARLAARIVALEKAGNIQAGTLAAHSERLLEIELSSGEWVPDVQWHIDNGYQL
jgi:hypothetical protein